MQPLTLTSPAKLCLLLVKERGGTVFFVHKGSYKNMRSIFVLLVLFILYPSLLIPQNINNSPKFIFPLDYMKFRVQPEEKLYPHLQFFEPGDLGISTSLTFLHLYNFISDSTFLIDTIYFFGFDKGYMEYRRIYSYDDLYRIKSVRGELFLGDNWNLHQVTELSYNKNGNIEKINYGRYEETFDSTIINYLYNEYGLLFKENASNVIKSDSLLENGWKKIYFYKNKNLVKYTFEKIGKPNWYEQDSVQYKYNKDNLPTQRTDFIPKIQGFDSLKFIWNYNNKLQLIEHHSLTYRRSDTLSTYSTKYKYNEAGNILKVISFDKDEYDKYPSRTETLYYYNNSERLDSISFLSYFIKKHSSDSLYSNGHLVLTFDLEGYLIGYTTSSIYKNILTSNRARFRRDKFNNVTFAQEESLSKGIWKPGPGMRIVYRKK